MMPPTPPPSSDTEVDDLRLALDATRGVLELIRELPVVETMEGVVQRGLEAAIRAYGGDGAMLAQRHDQRQEVLIVLGAAGAETALHPIGTLLGDSWPETAVARSGIERVSTNLEGEPESSPQPGRPRLPRAGYILPLRRGSSVIGTLTVSDSVGPWREPDEHRRLLVRTVADLVAAALMSVQTRTGLILRLEQIDALGRVAHALAGVEDTDHTMRLVAEEGMRVFGAERAGVFLIHRDTDRTECMVAIGLSERYVRAAEASSRKLRTTEALLRKEAVFLSQARGRPGSAFAPEVAAEGYRSVALLPLVFGGETIGALAYYHDRPKDYTWEERRLATAFGDQAALAIGKARLLDQVSRVKREWQTAFDAAGSGLAVTDASGIIVRANRFVAELADVTVHDLPGLDLASVFARRPAPDDDPLARARASGSPAAAMLESSDRRALVVTATPLPDGGLIVAIDDLTDVVRLEQRFRLVLETAYDAILLTDAAGTVLFANPAAAVVCGVALPELVGTPIDRFLPPTAEGPAGQPDADGLRYEAELLRPDGTVRRVAVSSARLRGPEEDAGRVAVLRDITQEFQTVSELRRSEARYRTLFTAAPLAILTLTDTGRFLSVNRAAHGMLGVAAFGAEAHLAEYVVESDRPAVARHLAAGVAGETREFGFRFRRADGVVREAAVVATPLESDAESSAVLAIARDVTDEHRLRERLVQAETMAALGQVVSGVAHELNNPLAGINALAQTLILEEPLDQGTRRVLESIRREGARAARIVADLLTSSRQRPLERRDIDLNSVVEEAVAVDAAAQGGADIRWELSLGAGLPSVSADADQLRQVLANLVANACHAMRGSATRIGRIRTFATGAKVGCEVVDTGPGIPAASLAKVFEPFFTTKVVGEGTGLGLAISRGIIEAHGGEIGAENLAAGGARFWFELPRHAGHSTR